MIDPSYIREILEIDFASGKMFWKKREAASARWNARYAGKEAFTAKRGNYFHGSIDGKLYQAHRVIYAAFHDVWPDLIDHINQDGGCNAIYNLRPANKSLNGFNSKVRKDSSTAITGVSWSKRQNAWRAYIASQGKQKHLGFYASQTEAAKARAQAFSFAMEPKG